MRILFVEDNIVIQKVHLEYLNIMALGATIDIANSGHAALNYFYTYQYDLILMDLGLPDIDGITLCSTFRNHLSIANLPIIAITAMGEDIKTDCMEAGINQLLQKPVDFDRFKEAVLHWLNLTKCDNLQTIS